MANSVNVELDEAFLKKFFALTEKELPNDQEVTMAMLRRQLDEVAEAVSELKVKLKDASKPTYTPANKGPGPAAGSTENTSFGFEEDTFNLPDKSILIIDDLGVITYQLEVLFKQLKFDVVTSKELYDAIDKFKKQYFDVVVMDLFIPTEREGLILLEELKKISAAKPKPSKIGVMSASSKKEHKQLCKMKGAEFFVEKADDWQKDLCRVVKSLVK